MLKSLFFLFIIFLKVSISYSQIKFKKYQFKIEIGDNNSNINFKENNLIKNSLEKKENNSVIIGFSIYKSVYTTEKSNFLIGIGYKYTYIMNFGKYLNYGDIISSVYIHSLNTPINYRYRIIGNETRNIFFDTNLESSLNFKRNLITSLNILPFSGINRNSKDLNLNLFSIKTNIGIGYSISPEFRKKSKISNASIFANYNFRHTGIDDGNLKYFSIGSSLFF